MNPHLPSAELQPWPEFCSLLKNNWGQRGDWMSLTISRWLRWCCSRLGGLNSLGQAYQGSGTFFNWGGAVETAGSTIC